MPTQPYNTMTTCRGRDARETRGQDARATRRAGLTLIELMVAMSILVILTLIVSQFIAQAQRVVTIGHATMRSNGKIAALKTIVRDDFRRITPAGFLYLDSSYTTSNPQPQGFLAFTTAGTADTMTPDASADAAGTIATYGLRNYVDATAGEKVLNRVCLMLNLHGALNEASDASPFDLADFQRNYYPDATTPTTITTVDLVAENLRAKFKFLPNNSAPVDAMKLLQKDLTIATIKDDSWKVMTPHVTGLEFFWTDGTVLVSGDTGFVAGEHILKWFGGKAGVRKSNPSDSPTANPLVLVESGGTYGSTNTGQPYKARWTNQIDPQYWPKAVKIVVTINDDSMKNFPREYEIICPVGP